MTNPDEEKSAKGRVAGTLLSRLFFVVDAVIGFFVVQRNGGPDGAATQQTDTAERLGPARSGSPRRNLATGTAVIGLIGGFIWMILTSWLLPNHPVVNNVALWGGIVVGVGIWAALLLRAKHTGKFD